MANLPLIGITQGDSLGIGPEIITKALSDPSLYRYCRPVIFGEERLFKNLQKNRNIPVVSPNRPYKNSAYVALEMATQWHLEKKIAAIVTSPVNKKRISSDEGIKFTGHTDYLKKRCEQFYKNRFSETMLFVGKKEKIALATTHIPLKSVSKAITPERLENTIKTVDEGLRHYFGLSHPSLAILGLNPHSGDEGLLGKEEKKYLHPAILWANKRKIDLKGPFPADSFFASLSEKFDATIALYHDQGLIPFKQKNFLQAVNLTLGLPLIRTSVDHGVAYDIHGQGKADPSSLVAAIRLAARLAKIGPPSFSAHGNH